MIHKETKRFRTGPGLCRGWSNHLGFAKFYTTLDEALADVPAEQRSDVVPAYVYLFMEPLDDVSLD